MLCVVYQIYRNNEKLPHEEVRARPREGWLVVGPDKRMAYPLTLARLLQDSRSEVDLLPPIRYPTVEINRGGLMISGTLERPSGVSVPHLQRWWCLVGPLDDTTTGEGAAYVSSRDPKTEAADERRRSSEIGRTMVNHYARRRG